MRIYKVPYAFNHEEKIFGGYLSLRQAIYLIFGALSVGIFFIPLVNIFIKSLLFLLKYFIYIIKFLFRKKQFILEKGKEE